MYVRTCCAVIDFNANVNRPNKVVNGETIYKLKVHLMKLQTIIVLWGQELQFHTQGNFQVDRSGENCQVVPEKDGKDTTWMDQIYSSCEEVVAAGETLDVEVLVSINIKLGKVS